MLQRLFFSFLSGFCLFISWPPNSFFTYLIFIALVPLLLLERDLEKKEISYRVYFFYAYLSFFIFNLCATFWIKNAHFGGAIFAILCNSFFMAFVFYLYAKIKNTIHALPSIFILTILWISFEYLHLNWDLSWPWLTFGNVFASHTNWIQWYSYTGVLGGSLWILVINFLFFRLYLAYCSYGVSFNAFIRKKQPLIYFISLLLLLIIPVITSIYIKHIHSLSYNSKKNPKIDVLIVQPNINPYTDKFVLSQKKQTNYVLDLIKPYVSSNLNYIILPETFLIHPIWEHGFLNNLDIKRLYQIVNEHPSEYTQDSKKYTYFPISILVGATTLDLSTKSATSKHMNNHKNQFYEVYNTALNIRNILAYEDSLGVVKSDLKVDKYHKSKLVPGAEQIPFNNFLHPLIGDQILQIGSSTSLGNFTAQDSISLFHSYTYEETKKHSRYDYSVAPIICYESIYGDYVRTFVEKGAEAIFIITNDGWWKKTSGYKQHNMYAKLRAIETRRYIARSANTGISCVINPFGKIEQQLNWDIQDVIQSRISLIQKQTFYTKHGDFIGRITSFLSVILLLYFIVWNKLQFSQ